LKNVAVNHNGVLTKSLEINYRPQGSTNQSRDFVSSAAKFSFDRFAVRSGVSCTWQHRVLGSDPALTLADLPTRDPVSKRSRAQNFGLTKANQRRTLSMSRPTALDTYAAQLIGFASVYSFQVNFLLFFY